MSEDTVRDVDSPVSISNDKQSSRLFFCIAPFKENGSFVMFARALTHRDATKALVEHWIAEGWIEDLDHIEKPWIRCFEMPTVEGKLGIVGHAEIDFVSVPKDELL